MLDLFSPALTAIIGVITYQYMRTLEKLLMFLISPLFIKIEFGDFSERSKVFPYINRYAFYSSCKDVDGKPFEWVLGRWFVAYVQGVHRSSYIYVPRWMCLDVLQTEKPVAAVATIVEEDGNTYSINKYTLMSTYFTHGSEQYYNTQLFSREEPLPEQQRALETIIQEAEHNHSTTGLFNLTTYIEGPPGCGKSFLGHLLAAKYGGLLSYDYNAITKDPGDFLYHLSRYTDDVRVLVFNEWDTVITHAFEEHSDKENKGLSSKQAYCNFMDTISRLAQTIVIFTSNVPSGMLESKYPGCLRSGRVNLSLRMSDTASVEEALKRRCGNQQW